MSEHALPNFVLTNWIQKGGQEVIIRFTDEEMKAPKIK